MRFRIICPILILVLLSASVPAAAEDDLPGATGATSSNDPLAAKKVVKSDREWAKQLTQAQFFVTRGKGTEPAFSGKYVHNHSRGVYNCVCCGAALFSSQTKFESGTGWPSFWSPIARDRIQTAPDYHGSEPRIEVTCSRCNAHLGHVFNDGPPPTGLRFCLNSVALKFVPLTAAKAKVKPTTKTSKKARPAPDAEPTPDSDPASSATPAP